MHPYHKIFFFDISFFFGDGFKGDLRVTGDVLGKMSLVGEELCFEVDANVNEPFKLVDWGLYCLWFQSAH